MKVLDLRRQSVPVLRSHQKHLRIQLARFRMQSAPVGHVGLSGPTSSFSPFSASDGSCGMPDFARPEEPAPPEDMAAFERQGAQRAGKGTGGGARGGADSPASKLRRAEGRPRMSAESSVPHATKICCMRPRRSPPCHVPTCLPRRVCGLSSACSACMNCGMRLGCGDPMRTHANPLAAVI